MPSRASRNNSFISETADEEYYYEASNPSSTVKKVVIVGFLAAAAVILGVVLSAATKGSSDSKKSGSSADGEITSNAPAEDWHMDPIEENRTPPATQPQLDCRCNVILCKSDGSDCACMPTTNLMDDCNSCRNGFYGYFCSEHCPTCPENRVCSNSRTHQNAQEACVAQDECPNQRFGPTCGGICSCQNGGVCRDGRLGDGACICVVPFHGVACENRCQPECVVGSGTSGSCDLARCSTINATVAPTPSMPRPMPTPRVTRLNGTS